jgi:sugar lactone lactonase YvrE
MRTTLLATGALVALAGLALLAPSADAAGHRYPPVVAGHAPALHPEGIAYDPSRHAFLVGSVRHGTVSVVAPDGSARTLVDDPRMPSTAGVHVDPVRGRILVTYGDIGVADRTEPNPELRRTGLGIFDLRTGRPQHVVDLGHLDPAGAAHLANDVAVDRAGNAYVTDSASDEIYRVDPAGRPSVFVRDARFATTTVGVNGIVWHPDGYLLVGKYDSGAVFRIDTAGRPTVTEVRLDRPLLGVDGIALRGNGTLLAVTNTLSAPAATDAVTVLRLRDGGRALREVSSTAWPVPFPTTIAVSPFGGYVVSGELDVLLGTGGTTDTFTLRRL